MITISNSLSFVRAPLALLFLQENAALRLLAILLAALTDCIDGYLARRTQSASRFGAVLDPAMDKFFVYFALVALYHEGQIDSWQIAAVASRDFFLCLYGLLMLATRRTKSIIFRSVRWGKITTALQFIVLAGLVYHISFSWIVFAAFVAFGWLAFLELFQLAPARPHEAKSS
jgi:CDP-diacylglycerol--glycerol-3-phosphate 3-phosphatidyltransferase